MSTVVIGEKGPSEAYDGCTTPQHINARYKALYAVEQEKHGTPFLPREVETILAEDNRRAHHQMVHGQTGKKVRVNENGDPVAAPRPKSLDKKPGHCVNGHDLRAMMPDDPSKSVAYNAPRGSTGCRLCTRERQQHRDKHAAKTEGCRYCAEGKPSRAAGGEVPK